MLGNYNTACSVYPCQQIIYPATPPYDYGAAQARAAAAAEAARNARERDFTIGMIDGQIRDLEAGRGRLDGQLRTGLNTLADDYDRGLGRLNQQQSRVLSKLMTQRGDDGVALGVVTPTRLSRVAYSISQRQ